MNFDTTEDELMSQCHQNLILPEALDPSRKVWRNFSWKFVSTPSLFCLFAFIVVVCLCFILFSGKSPSKLII